MAASVRPLRREVLHQAIQDQVKQYILDQGFQSGDMLPAESVLADELGISRPSLREASRTLQALGVVESRHGAGTFVGRFSLVPLVDGLTFSISLENETGTIQAIRGLLQVREILERSLVAQVVQILTNEQLSTLQGLVDAMDTHAEKGEDFTDEDRAFHQTLYQPLGNPLVVQLIQAFWEVFDRVQKELPWSVSNLKSTAQYHQRIVDALQARDGAAASMAMTEHFAGIWWRIEQASEGFPVNTGKPRGSAMTWG